MPNPHDFSDKDSFMHACMSARSEEGNDSSHKQSVAICLSMWREKGKKKKRSTSEIEILEKQGNHYEVDECLEILSESD